MTAFPACRRSRCSASSSMMHGASPISSGAACCWPSVRSQPAGLAGGARHPLPARPGHHGGSLRRRYHAAEGGHLHPCGHAGGRLGVALRPSGAVREPDTLRAECGHRISVHGGCRGIGQIWGALVGAGVMVVLRDGLQDVASRFLGVAGAVETVAYGLLIILLLQNARAGLVPFVTRRLPAKPPLSVPADAPRLPARPRPPRGETVLVAEKLVRRFGGLVAVNEVSFRLQAGEILGVIGPNGAGKEHAVQPFERRPAGFGRCAHGDGPARRRPLRPRHRGARPVADLPARAVAQRHERAGERRHRRPLAQLQGRALRHFRAGPARGRGVACRGPQATGTGGPWRLSRPAGGLAGAGPAAHRGDRPRPLPPIRLCCCWTSRPPACAITRSRRSANCWTGCGPRA